MHGSKANIFRLDRVLSSPGDSSTVIPYHGIEVAREYLRSGRG